MRDRRRTPAGGVQAEKQQRYVQLIAQGVNNSEACRLVGIDRKTGNRWRYGRRGPEFRRGACHLSAGEIEQAKPRSPRYLSEQERIQIADLLAAKTTVRGIAQQLGRAPSTISREIRRNSGQDGRYRPHHAEQFARRRACKPRQRRIAGDGVLAEVVQRLLAKRWSPEQVAHELRVLFAPSATVALAVETIYQAIYDTAVSVTRPARRRRRRRRLQGLQRRGRLTAMRMIEERPVEVADRVQAGHWEGDLIMGPGNRSAIGTLIERSTRYVILIGFPEAIPTAQSVRAGIEAAFVRLPAAMRRTLTWDQGKELAPPPADHRRDRGRRVLLRRARAVAARQQREHERVAARLLPQGHRSQPAHPRSSGPCRGRSERPASQDPRLVSTGRSVRHRARDRLTRRVRTGQRRLLSRPPRHALPASVNRLARPAQQLQLGKGASSVARCSSHPAPHSPTSSQRGNDKESC